MILKNLKNLLLAGLCDSSSIIYMLDTSGSAVNVYPTSCTAIFTPTSMGGDAYVRVGNGTTEATENDYNISTVSGVTYNSFTLTKALGRQDATFTYFATITNSSTSDIVISEIGIFMTVAVSSISNGSFLQYRETFEPITLAPGETRTFSIVLS